eukprot:03274.XXX_28242_28349_1 [CDS] Oithona nana genome sequencing.
MEKSSVPSNIQQEKVPLKPKRTPFKKKNDKPLSIL